jgi:hypothetical protein
MIATLRQSCLVGQHTNHPPTPFNNVDMHALPPMQQAGRSCSQLLGRPIQGAASCVACSQ